MRGVLPYLRHYVMRVVASRSWAGRWAGVRPSAGHDENEGRYALTRMSYSRVARCPVLMWSQSMDQQRLQEPTAADSCDARFVWETQDTLVHLPSPASRVGGNKATSAAAESERSNKCSRSCCMGGTLPV